MSSSRPCRPVSRSVSSGHVTSSPTMTSSSVMSSAAKMSYYDWSGSFITGLCPTQTVNNSPFLRSSMSQPKPGYLLRNSSALTNGERRIQSAILHNRAKLRDTFQGPEVSTSTELHSSRSTRTEVKRSKPTREIYCKDCQARGPPPSPSGPRGHDLDTGGSSGLFQRGQNRVIPQINKRVDIFLPNSDESDTDFQNTAE